MDRRLHRSEVASARRVVPVLLVLLVGCAPGDEARGAVQQGLEGGRLLGDCDWPNVGLLDTLCTATLIEDRWLLTAAHCTAGSAFRLGGQSTPITRCVQHPSFVSSGRVWDLMLCELATPSAAPTVPLLAPCEARALEEGPPLHRLLPVGTPVTVLGLGQPNTGQKRAVEMEADSIFYSPPLIGLAQPLGLGGARPGDSGGPTFLRMPDGTWRLVGVHKLGGAGSFVTDVFVAGAVTWMEQVIGRSLQPCHQDDTWAPGASCQALPSSLEDGGGSFPACSIGRATPVPTCVDGGPGDGGVTLDAGTPADGGATVDGGQLSDGGVTLDSGVEPDAGSPDAGADAGAPLDDAGLPVDAGAPSDAGPDDGGTDAGTAGSGEPAVGGCGCGETGPPLLLVVAPGLLRWRRRRRQG